MNTVLLTSVGTDSAPALCEGLRSWFGSELYLLGVDVKRSVPCQRMLNRFVSVPPRGSQEYVDALLELAQAESGTYIWPLSGEDQQILAAERDLAFSGCTVICSELDSVRIASDKIRLYEFSAANALPIPGFRVVQDLGSLKCAAHDLGYPDRPVVLKVAVGTGALGLKIIRADASQEAMFLSRLNRDVTLDRVLVQLGGVSDWPRMLITEYLPGEEFSVDVLLHRRRWYGGAVRRRDASIFGLATDATVVDRPDLLRLARAFGEALKLDFVANLQFRGDQQGNPQLIEINPRVPGTIGLTIAAGCNLPAAALALAMGREARVETPRTGTRILRYFAGTIFEP